MTHPTAKLGDVADFIRDGTHGSPARTEAGIPVLSAMNVKDGRLSFETDRYTSDAEFDAFLRRVPLATGDVLLTIVGTIGRAAVVQQVRPLVFQRSVAVIRPSAAALDSRFLYHVTQSLDFQTQLDRASNKSSQAGVYLGKLSDVKVPLPPLAEQRRIAAILDKADALRTKRREALAQLDRLAQATFVDMFGGKVGKSSGWPEVQLSDVADTLTGYPFQSSQYADGPREAVRLCRGTNVMPTRLDWSDTAWWPKGKTSTVETFELREGDIVMAMDRPWISEGFKLAQIEQRDCPSYLVQRVTRIRAKPTSNAEYLYHLLAQPEFTRHCKPTETTVPHISPKDIRSFRFHLPPSSLQTTFAERLRTLGNVRSASKAAKVLSESQFSSLQQRAFSGEL